MRGWLFRRLIDAWRFFRALSLVCERAAIWVFMFGRRPRPCDTVFPYTITVKRPIRMIEAAQEERH